MTRGIHRLLGGLALASATAAVLAAAPPQQQTQERTAFANYSRSMKAGASAKLGGHLQSLARVAESQAQLSARARSTVMSRLPGLTIRDRYVAVSAYADGDVNALRTELVAKGMTTAAVHGNAVTGRVPIDALSDMSSIPTLRFMRPSMARTHVGLTTSQGDRSQRSDVARQRFNVNGRGVRVGVMSDSYNCSEGALVPGEPFTTAPQDKASNDLPQDVLVLKDLSPTPSSDCADEGRGMMQLIHDVAPASSLAFYTAFESAEDFAAGIVALADAGSKVIVDDVIYFAEPMFLDGPIAQAADRVKSRGVAYFSSAGNEARQSYESAFRRSGSEGAGGGVLHDFDRGKAVDDLQGITARSRQRLAAVVPVGPALVLGERQRFRQRRGRLLRRRQRQSDHAVRRRSGGARVPVPRCRPQRRWRCRGSSGADQRQRRGCARQHRDRAVLRTCAAQNEIRVVRPGRRPDDRRRARHAERHVVRARECGGSRGRRRSALVQHCRRSGRRTSRSARPRASSCSRRQAACRSSSTGPDDASRSR